MRYDYLYSMFLGRPRVPRERLPVAPRRGRNGVSLRMEARLALAGASLRKTLVLTTSNNFRAGRGWRFGAVDYARPDRWGERVIQYLVAAPSPSGDLY